jgi:hypothetical protein
MSGGGTTAINFPVFMALGMPIPLALATISLNSAFWVLPASRNYLKGRNVDWKFLIFFSLIGLIGTYFSIKFVLGSSQRIFEIVMGSLIIFLVIYTYFKKELGLTEHKVYSKTRQMCAYPFALLLGFYENAFGSGNALAFSLITFYTKGFDFIDALGHYYAVAFVWTVAGVILFFKAGFYDFTIMPIAVIGSMIGAYIGSKYARQKGNKFIKIAFVIIGGILGLKLLLGV